MAAAWPLPEPTPDGDELDVVPELVVPVPVEAVPLEVSEPVFEVVVVLAMECAASPITAVAASAVAASPDVTATVPRRARSR